jgi:hypothetical protein
MLRRTFLGSGMATAGATLISVPAIAITPPSLPNLKAALLANHLDGTFEMKAKHRFLDVVLDNTIEHLRVTDHPDPARALRDAYYVAANMAAHDLVSVQPMWRPMSLVYALPLPFTYTYAATAKARKVGISPRVAVATLDRMVVDRLRHMAVSGEMCLSNRQLPHAIRRQAVMIAKVTGRAMGNWCVVSRQQYDDLATHKMFTSVAAPASGIRFVGWLGEIKVFVDSEADMALVGYRGNFEGAAVFAGYTPYIDGVARYDWIEASCERSISASAYLRFVV